MPLITRKRASVGAPLLAAAAAVALVPAFAGGSSHREAPAISQDPTADNTDVYAFRTPDNPATKVDESDYATLIANFVPFAEPAGGPNFHRFSDNVSYRINVDNTGDGVSDVQYVFRFKTTIRNKDSFLYNSGPITFEDGEYKNLNLSQTYKVVKITRGKNGKRVARRIGHGLVTPPNNVGPTSTPDYERLAQNAVHRLRDGSKVFAGQRDDPFYVDLGGTFDLINFRGALPGAFSSGGDDGLTGFNVQTIAIQVPIKKLTRNGDIPTDLNSTSASIGVYSSTARPVVRHRRGKASVRYQQVSRLGEPLVNEVLIPLGRKDQWNRSKPKHDSRFERHYTQPELAGVLNALFDIGAPTTGRVDLSTILLRGIPPNNPLGAPATQIGDKPRAADLLRVNLAAEPTPFAEQDRLGLLAGQADGFPNGRRLVDDVVDIEERAVAGALAPAFGLPAPSGSNGALAGELGDGVNENDQPFLTTFPYVGTPISGFDTEHPRPPTFPPAQP